MRLFSQALAKQIKIVDSLGVAKNQHSDSLRKDLEPAERTGDKGQSPSTPSVETPDTHSVHTGDKPQNFMSVLLNSLGLSRSHNTARRRAYGPQHLYEQGLERYFTIAILIIAVALGFATYAAMTETLPFENSSRMVVWLLNADLIVLLVLLFLTANRLIKLWNNRRKGVAGSQLQTRLIMIFSALAAVPAVLMMIFSAYFFHYGIQTWFSDQVRTAVNESQVVAEAYLAEHQQVIRADIMAMAQDLDRDAPRLLANPQGFQRFIATQIQFRNFSEAVVFSEGQDIITEAGRDETGESGRTNLTPPEVMTQAQDGSVVLMTAPNENRVRALVRLQNFEDAYLYVARPADPRVLARVDATRQAAARYQDLERTYSDLQIKSLLIFIVVALVLLLSAIWAGLILARQMTAPVTALIGAAERVRSGDLSVRVPEFETLDELDYLSRGFNRMTAQISAQREELIGANRQLDTRRRFIETVLAGVSAGIVGVDKSGVITIANQIGRAHV